MVYLDTALGSEGVEVAFSLDALAEARPETVLSAIERAVVRFSRHDPLSSLSASTPLDRLRAAIFGRRTVTELADPKLEALRRYSLFARRGAVPSEEEQRLIATGYTLRHAAEARRIVGERALT